MGESVMIVYISDFIHAQSADRLTAKRDAALRADSPLVA